MRVSQPPVYSHCRDDLVHYIKTHYKGHRMVLAGAGGVAHEDLCKLATQHFGKISNVYESEIPKDVPCRYTGKNNFTIFSLNVFVTKCLVIKNPQPFWPTESLMKFLNISQHSIHYQSNEMIDTIFYKVPTFVFVTTQCRTLTSLSPLKVAAGRTPTTSRSWLQTPSLEAGTGL